MIARAGHTEAACPDVFDQLVGWAVVQQHRDSGIVTLMKDIWRGQNALTSRNILCALLR